MISLAQLRLATKVRGTSQDPYLKALELAADERPDFFLPSFKTAEQVLFG